LQHCGKSWNWKRTNGVPKRTANTDRERYCEKKVDQRDGVLTTECDDADDWCGAGLDSSLGFPDWLLYQADGRQKE